MANITAPIILDSTGQSIATAISNMSSTSIGNMSALTTTDKTSLVGAVNEVNSNLSSKQDKTDNNLTTTDKTTTGAINEVKSGLTNVDVALSVPEGTGKNVIPMTLAAVKAANTVGTWSGNAYTANDVTFTVQTDGDENIVGITANGTATQGTLFYLYKKGSDTSFPTNDYILTGCADGGSNSTWRIIGVEVESGSNVYFGDSGSGATFNTTATKYLNQLYIEVFSGVNISNKTFYPMVRYATITDSTFAPYIPSVESRIEAVENNKQDTLPITFIKGTADPEDNTTYIFNTTVSALSLFIFFGQGTGSAGNNGKNYIFTVASNYGNSELNITKIAGDYDISGFTVTKTATGFTINTGSGFSRTFFCVKLS